MAKNKKDLGGGNVKIRDLNPPRVFRVDNEFEKYAALAMNSIKITCSDPLLKFGYLEEKFIKEQLLYANAVGYDAITRMFAKVVGDGLNDYWAAKTLTFIYPNGISYRRRATYEPSPMGAYMIVGYPANFTLANMIQKATDTMQLCDELIIQNLEASKTPHYVLCKDENTKLSLLQAIRQRQQGEPVILVDSSLGELLKGIENLTDFIAPEVYQHKQKVRDELLNELGTLTANIDKKERVQVGEVNAMVGVCEDFLYSMIDNVNRQFEAYGLPFKMEINTSLEELYTNNNIKEGENIV